MTKILGLDLGTNSIGWALIDYNKKGILEIGSRIFPEGVENLGEGEGREVSKNASRTQARGTRRQFFRRRLRKRYLLRELAKNNMCPISFDQVKVWTDNSVFEDQEFINWLRLNPYELRSKALHEEISLIELGRIFYHLIQRRGFLSNSRNAGADEGVIYDGVGKENKIGITQTANSIAEKETLGSYLNQIHPKIKQPFKQNMERIRNRYTTREMYTEEFERIWDKQSTYHQELTKELKTHFGGRKKQGYAKDGILFHQRPLRSQKHLVGKCTFEKNKNKCPISAIPFEKFRVHQWVNTVECNGEKLSRADRDSLVKFLFSKEKIAFKSLRKAIRKSENVFQFNYKDDDKITGSYTISNLSNKKFFGESWFDLSEKEQEDIWHILYSFEDRDYLKRYAISKWGFDEVKASNISRFKLKEGYSNLSRKAIKNILPFLEMGITYDKAVTLGGIRNAFEHKWEHLEGKQAIIDSIDDIIGKGKKGGYIHELRAYLKEEYGLNEKQLKKLYHHSAKIEATNLLDKLPVNPKADKEIQGIRNPIVITAIFEIRKLVNEIIDDYGKPDQIKVELARDLKVSKSKRNQVRREQKRLERENDRIKSELDYLGQRISHENLLKYKLWEECNKTCPYTGKEICISQLFSGEIQIEHIYPWSRSLNDSYMNKTLCFADENRAKGDLTPFEFYSRQSEEKWEAVKAQALSCFKNKPGYPNAYQKFKQFVRKTHDDDFISRQLNDTRYISKEAKNYLAKICNDVQVSPGQMTANLRHKWGLNSILGLDNEKTRDDHRHHAIDALVMACSTRSHLQELSKWNRYERMAELKEFPMPWETFRQDAELAVKQILVSHKKNNALLTQRTTKTKKNGKEYLNLGIAARGQLHKETVFGKRQAPHAEEAFHIRKPIADLKTKKQVDKVVDPTIRRLIYERIKALGGFINGKDVPKDAFFKVDEEGILQPQLFLPNKNGEPVPIKKVRMREHLSGAEMLSDKNQWVNPRKNHHVLIYKNEDGELKEDVVTFWTAIERKRQKQPVIQLPAEDKNGEMLTTLQINDIFVLGLSNEEFDQFEVEGHSYANYLYRVQKLSTKFYEFRLVSESKIDKTKMPFLCRIQSFGDGKTGWKRFNPIKVKVSSAGKISRL
jgi:CRISPR-associated endonuclease Csn1